METIKYCAFKDDNFDGYIYKIINFYQRGYFYTLIKRQAIKYKTVINPDTDHPETKNFFIDRIPIVFDTEFQPIIVHKEKIFLIDDKILEGICDNDDFIFHPMD